MSTNRPPSVTIRPATLDDAQALTSFALNSFLDTYGAYNDPAVIGAHVEQAFSRPAITEDIKSTTSKTLLCCVDDRIAGYVKLGTPPAPDCLSERESIEIERLYADKAYHGTGVGAALMAAAVDYARTEGRRAIWLGVWKQNPRAVRFYEKNGFTIVGTHTFMMAHDPQDDWVMERIL